MYTVHRFSALCGLFLLAFSLPAQSTFQRNYLTPDSTAEALAVAVAGGRYAVCGYLESEANPGSWDAALWVVDGQGALQQTQRFFRTGSQDIFTDLVGEQDGSVVATYITTSGVSSTRSGVLKIDASGNEVWTYQLGNEQALFNRIVKLSNGYLLLGSVIQDNVNRAIALKINNTGTQIWQVILNGESSVAEDAVEVEQGFIYLCGRVSTDGLLAKLSPVGELIWSKRYASSQDDYFSQIEALPNNRLLLGGSSNGFGNSIYTQPWLVQTDTDGGVRWSRTYSMADHDMVPTEMLVASGTDNATFTLTETGAASNNGAVLAGVNGIGDLTFQNSYGPQGTSAFFDDFVPVAGGGYLLVGNLTNGSGKGAFLVKTDAEANVQTCCPKSVSLDVRDVTLTVNNANLSRVTGAGLIANGFGQAGLTTLNNNLCPVVNTDFTLSQDTICPGECINVSFTSPTPNVDYAWIFPTGEPSSSDLTSPGQVCFSTVASPGISLLVNGCPAATKVLVVSTGANGKIPNAFTPDGDLVNDVFKPILTCPVQDYLMHVYNRWGDIIFESYQQDVGWDGTIDGVTQAPVDVYYFRAEFTSSVNGAPRVERIQGDITLLR